PRNLVSCVCPGAMLSFKAGYGVKRRICGYGELNYFLINILNYWVFIFAMSHEKNRSFYLINDVFHLQAGREET
ncbi:MAG: hypothetical protein J7L26_08355, partial [Candidatus Aminicenantes bacterium]|nr:hypothetical protein [Candidatus Aminicenantes bacterium]